MPHDMIDNRAERLVDHIKETLPASETAKFAGVCENKLARCFGVCYSLSVKTLQN